MRRRAFLLVIVFHLGAVSAWAATPGLPFTEDFSDTNLCDTSQTNANWSTEEQSLFLAWRKERQYGAFAPGNTTGTDISSDADDTYAVALGDVDGDGDLDLVVGNNGLNRLYLNNGSSDPWGGVTGSNITGDSDDTRAVALGDVDSDGDLDLVVGNYNEPNLLYLNNGTADPWRVSGTDITSDAHATYAVVLGDIDGDGNLDLVVGNYGQRNRLYLNGGTSDPWNGVTGIDITADAHPTADVALADMDSDGDLDLVVGNVGTNRVYLSDGTGTGWSGSDITADSHDTQTIGLGDVDGDGDVDVVAGNLQPSGEVNRLYMNDGTGTGWTSSDITSDAHVTYAVALGDVDGDGDLDLLSGNDSEPNRLYLNNGTTDPWNGVSGTDITSDAHNTHAVVAGDVDGDGDLDLIVGNSGEANRLYINNANGDPWNGVGGSDIGTDTGWDFSVALGDVDRDGDLDLVVANYLDPTRLYLNNGTTDPWNGVTGIDIASDTESTWAVALGDVDSDGDLDLIVGKNASTNRLYLNNGTADPWNKVNGEEITSDLQWTYAVALGDVDSDGDLDLVVGNEDFANRLYLNNGTSDPWSGVTGIDITSDVHPTYALVLGDVDGDDDLDLIVGNTYDCNRLYLNNGTADPWSGVTGVDITSDAHATRSLALGDVDRDGDLDLVVGNKDDQYNRLYLNNGTSDPWGGVTGIDITSDLHDTCAVSLGDVDGDCDLDLVVGNRSFQYNRLYLNNGTSNPWGGVTGSDITSDWHDTCAVALGDVDGDGDLDLVLSNGGGDRNRLYLNQAAPLDPWKENTVTGSDITSDTHKTCAVAVWDVDRDGDLDLIVGNYGNAPNRLYLNNGTSDPWDGVIGADITTDANNTTALALGDVDGDGDLDLVAGNYWQRNRVYFNDGDGYPWDTATAADITTYTARTLDVVLGDVNADGHLDLIAGNADKNYLYLNDGSGNPWDTATPIAITSDKHTTHAVALGDVDSDGDLDLVVGNVGTNRVYLSDGTGTGWSGSDITADSHDTHAIALGDVDGDGDLDLVAGNTGETNRLYLNDGSGDPWDTVAGIDITTDVHGTATLALVDIDGDGDLDVIAGNGNDTHRLYLNNGSSNPFSGVTGIDIMPGDDAVSGLAIGDMDGDGRLDIVAGRGGSAAFRTNRLYRRIGPYPYHTGQGRATSLEVDTKLTDIKGVVLSSTCMLPHNTWIDYRLSNNGGVQWWLVKPGEMFTFPTAGSYLRWRVELGSLSPAVSPVLDEICLASGVASIDPPVPDMETYEDVVKGYDLTPHENDYEDFGPQLNWSIEPADTSLYTAAIDSEDVLTITPKFNQSGVETNVTLTLTDSDGDTDAQEISITVVYRPPTAPTPFVLPLDPYTTDDLICIILPGFVGPGRTAQHEYTWSNGSRDIVHGPQAGIVDELSWTETAPGEVWMCAVRTFDGATWSPSLSNSSEVIQDKDASTLTLNAVPDEITLGYYVTLSGSISPSVGAVPVLFDETVTPPGGTDTKPQTVNTNASSAFSQQFLPDEAGSWGLSAEWLGNKTTCGDFAVAAVAVNKAQPSLALELSASSVPLNYDQLEATAVLAAPIPGQLSHLLSSLTVELWLKKPDAAAADPVVGTTDADGVVTFAPGDFSAAGIVFNEPGTWQFLAEFEGDSNFLPATSVGYDEPDSVRLTVKDRAGYAVIVVGQLDQYGEGHAEHAKTGDFVYRSFRDRGFAHEDIYYLREGPVQPAADIYVDDTTPAQRDVEYAISSWALGEMNSAGAPLYIVLLDHGSAGAFYAYSGSYDETRIITPVELSGYLDTLQSNLNPEAADQDIILVHGACHSGSFIEAVSSPRRVVITSCSAEEASHRGVEDPMDGVRDGEAFVTEFFGHARAGKTLKESFEIASEKTYEYTATRSNSVEPLAHPQHPLLDDNGDGLGTSGSLSFQPGEDGGHSHELVLGYGVNAGASVGWITATQTLYLGPGEPVGQLFAKATEWPATDHFAWLEVKTPSYSGSTVVDPGNPDSQEVVEMPVFDYEPGISDSANGYFRWETFGGLFDGPGTYKVFCYVQDGNTGDTSTYMLTTIYRASTTNQAPPAVTLLHPDDGDTVSGTVFFMWQASADPDGDVVTYRLEVAEDSNFTQGLIVKEGIPATYTVLTDTDGLADLTQYYWRVIPVDEYGASPTTNTVRTFDTDFHNALLPGTIVGIITEAVSSKRVGGASVSLQGKSKATISDVDGVYVFAAVPPQAYIVAVSASGYVSRASSTTVNAGDVAVVNFQLAPTEARFLWGEVSADGIVGTMDGSMILQWKVGLVDHFPIDPSVVYPDFPPCADVNDDGTVGTLDASEVLQLKVSLIAHFTVDLDGDGCGPDGAKHYRKSLSSYVTRFVSAPERTYAAPGDEIEVPIMVDDASDVLGYFSRLSFDSSILEYLGAANGSLATNWGQPMVNPLEGRVVIAGAGVSPLAGSGSLVVVQFRVNDSAAGRTSPLHFEAVELNDGQIPVQMADGEVTVAGEGEGENRPPVADAGPDQVRHVFDTLTLDGGGSSDPDGDSLTFSWSFVALPEGSSAEPDDAASVNPVFTADSLGEYVIQLIVNDGTEDSEADTVTVSATNNLPVADAGPDQTRLLDDTVTLDGSGSSDVDGDSLTYSWSFVALPEGSNPALDDPGAVRPVFTIDVPGCFDIELIVNDGIVDSLPDTVRISTENSAPVANAGPDQTGRIGDVITLDGSGSSDVDGDPFTYAWKFESLPEGSAATLDDPTAVKPAFTIDVTDQYVIGLIVNDGTLDSELDTVTVYAENTPPVAEAGLNQSGQVGSVITLDGSGSSDVDGDPLTFRWSIIAKPEGSSVELNDPAAISPTFTIDVFGDYVVQLIVNDGTEDSAPDTASLSTDNTQPVADAGLDQTGHAGERITLDDGDSFDVDGHSITYWWSIVSKPTGSGAALDDPAAVTPAFTIDVPGDYIIQLIVSDGIEDSAPDTVTVSAANSRPVADAGIDQTTQVNEEVTLDGSGSSDADGDPLTFAWSMLSRPTGSIATPDDSTAENPTFIPEMTGDYLVQLIVSDGFVNSEPDSVRVTAEGSGGGGEGEGEAEGEGEGEGKGEGEGEGEGEGGPGIQCYRGKLGSQVSSGLGGVSGDFLILILAVATLVLAARRTRIVEE